MAAPAPRRTRSASLANPNGRLSAFVLKLVAIVAMTANTFKEDVDAAMDSGMNGFIPKPLDVEILYRLLRDLLHR